MEIEKLIAIVPAAGCGSRMNSAVPKQYLKINGITVLEHTINKLLSYSKIEQVIVALSANDDIFSTLPIAKQKQIITVTGGNTRAESVLSGLKNLDENHWAIVHDAVRPCLHHDDIEKLVSTVLMHQQGGILATRIIDTVKKSFMVQQDKAEKIEQSLDRTFLWGAVTPQMFNVGELKRCLTYALASGQDITDEASAIEFCGGHPLLVEGRRDNIKITRAEDIALATFYLAGEK